MKKQYINPVCLVVDMMEEMPILVGSGAGSGEFTEGNGETVVNPGTGSSSGGSLGVKDGNNLWEEW